MVYTALVVLMQCTLLFLVWFMGFKMQYLYRFWSKPNIHTLTNQYIAATFSTYKIKTYNIRFKYVHIVSLCVGFFGDNVGPYDVFIHFFLFHLEIV